MAENDPTTGEVLVPEELYMCGYAYFPALAEPLIEASEYLSQLYEFDARAFNAPDGSHIIGEAYPAWSNLRDALQDALSKSVDNLYATGDTLALTAQHFAEQDGISAAELQDAVEDLNFDVPAVEDRPRVPSAEDSQVDTDTPSEPDSVDPGEQGPLPQQ